MIQFNNLKFVVCLKTSIDPTKFKDNEKAEINVEEHSLDIIKIYSSRTYKVKPFEKVFDKKRYLRNVFPEYGEFPIFNSKELLIEFLNSIENKDEE